MHRLAVVCLACFATTASPGDDLAIINANLIDGIEVRRPEQWMNE